MSRATETGDSPNAPERIRAERIRAGFVGALTVAGALALGAVAFIVVLFLAKPLTDTLGHLVLGRTTYAEYAGAGFVAGMLWVWVGSQAGPPGWRDRLAVLLYAAGAYAAWRLLGRNLHGSPCNGLIELAATFAGGGLGVILAGLGTRPGRFPPRRETVMAGVLLPLMTWLIVAAAAWFAPRLGGFAAIHLDADDTREARYVSVEASGAPGEGSEEIMWAKGSTAKEIERTAAAGPILIERLHDSGPQKVPVEPVPASAMHVRVEAAVRVHLRRAFAGPGRLNPYPRGDRSQRSSAASGQRPSAVSGRRVEP